MMIMTQQSVVSQVREKARKFFKKHPKCKRLALGVAWKRDDRINLRFGSPSIYHNQWDETATFEEKHEGNLDSNHVLTEDDELLNLVTSSLEGDAIVVSIYRNTLGIYQEVLTHEHK